MNVQVEIIGKGVVNADIDVDSRDAAIEGVLMTVEDQLGVLHPNQIGELTIGGALIQPEYVRELWQVHRRYKEHRGF